MTKDGLKQHLVFLWAMSVRLSGGYSTRIV